MATVKDINNSLVDQNRIPYVQMNRPKTAYWSTLDKTLFWAGPLIIFLGISVLLLVVAQRENILTYENAKTQQTFDDSNDSLNWNELTFTQLWGYSECLEFKDKHSQDFTCRFEDKHAFWSVHGIWPTKEGTRGPSFCSKVKFDISLLDPIRSSLDEYWYEIDSTKQGDYFWSHEWTKHGSCAKELDKFETELKYFSAGLEFRNKYDLFTILKNGNIVPENPNNATGYDVEQISNAIATSLGDSNTPYIQCLSKKNQQTDSTDYYLLAIELCLDKTLQLISCSQSKRLSQSEDSVRDSPLPCPKNTPIKYLDHDL